MLSPLADHRFWCFNEFLGHVRALQPPPQEIVVCIDADSEIDLTEDGYKDLKVEISPAIEYYRGHLERICSAREILRKHFIYHPANWEYALWLDSDILVPPETVQTLRQVMEKHKCLTVVNKYRGRNGSMWCGSGVMLTHRVACTASKFWVGYINKDGEEKHLSEDLIFFALLDQGKFFLKQWIGRSGRVCDEYVKVKHLI